MFDRNRIAAGDAGHTPAHPRATKAYSLVRQNWRALVILVTILVDAAAVVLAGVTAYVIRQMLELPFAITLSTAVGIIGASCGVTIFIALLTGIYRMAYRVPLADQYRDAARAYVYSACTIIFGMYLIMGRDLPPRFTGFFLVLIPMFFLAGRWTLSLATHSFHKKGYGRYNTMIVNWNGLGANSPDRFTMFPELGYAVRAFACAGSNGQQCIPGTCTLQNHFATLPRTHNDPALQSLPCFGLGDLSQAIESEGIERIFVPLVKPVVTGFADIVHVCVQHRVKLKVISRESEELLRFSRVKDIAGISLYSPPKRRTRWIKARLKRLFDFGGSLLLIAIFSPVFIAVTLAILIEDGRPVFFRQKRASMKGGKSFTFFKFRSMERDAEARQSVLNHFNQTDAGLFLLKGDPRVTCVGRWIRKFSMDELPQLFNVLRGEMSLVGPRPLAMSDLDSISSDNDYAGYYYLRDNTPPGMTGLWQICGRRDVPFREMVLLDLYYIENQSIMFDLEILFATIPVVLFGRGAY